MPYIQSQKVPYYSITLEDANDTFTIRLVPSIWHLRIGAHVTAGSTATSKESLRNFLNNTILLLRKWWHQ